MIHSLFGMTTSKARIATPPSKFTTIRILIATCAICTAANDEIGFDIVSFSYIEHE
jgi:hypothetical protein